MKTIRFLLVLFGVLFIGAIVTFIIFLKRFELLDTKEIKLGELKGRQYKLNSFRGNMTVSSALKLYKKGEKHDVLIEVKEVFGFYVKKDSIITIDDSTFAVFLVEQKGRTDTMEIHFSPSFKSVRIIEL